MQTAQETSRNSEQGVRSREFISARDPKISICKPCGLAIGAGQKGKKKEGWNAPLLISQVPDSTDWDRPMWEGGGFNEKRGAANRNAIVGIKEKEPDRCKSLLSIMREYNNIVRDGDDRGPVLCSSHLWLPRQPGGGGCRSRWIGHGSLATWQDGKAEWPGSKKGGGAPVIVRFPQWRTVAGISKLRCVWSVKSQPAASGVN